MKSISRSAHQFPVYTFTSLILLPSKMVSPGYWVIDTFDQSVHPLILRLHFTHPPLSLICKVRRGGHSRDWFDTTGPPRIPYVSRTRGGLLCCTPRCEFLLFLYPSPRHLSPSHHFSLGQSSVFLFHLSKHRKILLPASRQLHDRVRVRDLSPFSPFTPSYLIN